MASFVLFLLSMVFSDHLSLCVTNSLRCKHYLTLLCSMSFQLKLILPVVFYVLYTFLIGDSYDYHLLSTPTTVFTLWSCIFPRRKRATLGCHLGVAGTTSLTSRSRESSEFSEERRLSIEICSRPWGESKAAVRHLGRLSV